VGRDSSPPGSAKSSTERGKTALLSACAHDPAERRPIGWPSMDEADDEPVRFWTYALSALAAVAPQLAGDALAALSGQGLYPVDLAILPCSTPSPPLRPRSTPGSATLRR
jgi:hypothetical protein